MKIVHNQEEEELISGCLNNNRVAQKRLYEKYYSKMLSVCMRYASCRDEAAGVLNEGFYKVFTHLNKFKDSSGNLEAWIYRIMINTSIDHYRSETKQRQTQELKQDKISTLDDFDIIAQLNAEEIIELVQSLPSAYRTVFSLYVIEGMSHKEISESLGISEGTSKSNLFKAKQKMKELVENKFSIKWTENVGTK